MSTKHNTPLVLSFLARSLSVKKTLEHFPGLTRDNLSSILETASQKTAPEGQGPAVLWVDGAARGNPGPAGAGAYLVVPGKDAVGRGEFLGVATNNVAEYSALIMGLAMVEGHGLKSVGVRSDSELMVRQMTGEYRVKNEKLKSLFAKATKAVTRLESVTFEHIPREENREADQMANRAVDAKGTVVL